LSGTPSLMTLRSGPTGRLLALFLMASLVITYSLPLSTAFAASHSHGLAQLQIPRFDVPQFKSSGKPPAGRQRHAASSRMPAVHGATRSAMSGRRVVAGRRVVPGIASPQPVVNKYSIR